MRATIVLISTGIGGTEKRYANLYRFFRKNSDQEYQLVISEGIRKKLVAMGLLPEKDENIISIFTRFPASIFNILPITVAGYPIKGVVTLLYPILRKQIEQVIYCSGIELKSDLLHFALAHKLLFPIESKLPVICEAQDATLSNLKEKSHIVKAVRDDGIYFNCASKRIWDAYTTVSGSRDKRRFYLNARSFIDHSRTYVGEKRKLIAFVGNMHPTKNSYLMLEAIRIVLEKHRNILVRFMTKTPINVHFAKRIKKYALENIIECGYEPNPEKVFSEAIIFLSLQKHDNFHSQALMEAMACGCAVIATDCGETWRWVNSKNGFRVKEDPVEIAERICELIDNPELAKEMGENGREQMLSEQTIVKYADALEKLYLTVAKKENNKIYNDI